MRTTSATSEGLPLQLDRTHVEVRVRTLSEIGDLAMVMIRRYPSALFVGFTIGALPWLLANTALLAWIPIQESQYGLLDESAQAELYRYSSWMALLVVLQTPAAGVLTTIYLGQAVFEKRPPWSYVFRKARRHFWRWFWVLGVRRLAIPVMILLAFRYDTQFDGFIDVAIPIGLLICLAVFRSSRPFMPEILLLEECPLKDGDPRVITAKRRSKALHSPMGGELSGRFLAVSFLAFWIAASVLYSLVFVRGIATGAWDWDTLMFVVCYPLALWAVAGLSVLIRILSYLDTRIRLEGWEVELKVRAEAIRQFGEDVARLTAGIIDAAGVTAKAAVKDDTPSSRPVGPMIGAGS